MANMSTATILPQQLTSSKDWLGWRKGVTQEALRLGVNAELEVCDIGNVAGMGGLAANRHDRWRNLRQSIYQSTQTAARACLDDFPQINDMNGGQLLHILRQAGFDAVNATEQRITRKAVENHTYKESSHSEIAKFLSDKRRTMRQLPHCYPPDLAVAAENDMVTHMLLMLRRWFPRSFWETIGR